MEINTKVAWTILRILRDASPLWFHSIVVMMVGGVGRADEYDDGDADDDDDEWYLLSCLLIHVCRPHL